MSSAFVIFSPFLYSSGESSRMIRGFKMRRLIFPGDTTSLLNMTPCRTFESSNRPPGIFSTLLYFLMSTSCWPFPKSTEIVDTASMARSCDPQVSSIYNRTKVTYSKHSGTLYPKLPSSLILTCTSCSISGQECIILSLPLARTWMCRA